MADSPQTYTDLRSVDQYRKLLRNLHTLNATESHVTLVRMLEGLLASPLGPEEQLEVLESARQTITFVQHEMSSRYAAHPLPPDSQEDATLRQVVRLWTALSTAYARLAEGGSGSDEFRAQWPLLAQRRIQCRAPIAGGPVGRREIVGPERLHALGHRHARARLRQGVRRIGASRQALDQRGQLGARRIVGGLRGLGSSGSFGLFHHRASRVSFRRCSPGLGGLSQARAC